MKSNIRRITIVECLPTLPIRSGILPFAILCLVGVLCHAASGAEQTALSSLPKAPAAKADLEQQLIAVLTSGAPPNEKDAACQKLKLIGSSRCVPAVAALLKDEKLSHTARYVLESMPLAEAGAALIAALNQTSGQIQLGIICSLGSRAEARAVPALARLAKGQDREVSVAAAEALGHIETAEALKALQSLASKSEGRVHTAAVDGMLRCANTLVRSGRSSKAYSVYEKIYSSEKSDGFRLAAYRGMIRSASTSAGLHLTTRAIANGPSPAQLAALQMAREIQARGATESLAGLLPQVDPPVQLALVEALAQRGDAAATPQLSEFVPRALPEVRVATLRALGNLGNATVVPLLAQFAASGTPEEQAAARLALVNLRRGNVAEAMVSQLALSSPGVQGELARALGERGDRSALPRLLELAQKGPEGSRQAAIKALGLLAEQTEVTALVQLVLGANDPRTRSQAAESLNQALQGLAAKRGAVNAKALVEGARTGPAAARIALFPICSGLINPDVRLALRAGIEDRDPQVAAAASRALCETIDPELVEDVLTLARTAKDEKIRSLAVAGGVRLLTQEETVKFSRGQRVASLRVLLGVATRPEDKRLVIAGLGEMPDLDALRAMEPLLEDNNLKSEAALASSRIAVGLPGAQAREAMALLQKALGNAGDDPARKALETALKQMQTVADYVTDWMAAGPFRQEGKDYAALFDIVFPPETDNPKGVEWKPLPAGADPKRPYVMDLFKLFGGQQCVAYARTWVHCDKDVPVLLELGSDDGIKVWLNDKQVYALNTARALQPGTDKVTLNLHSGWNMLLFKVTQNNLGWEFCARLLNPDGSHLDGLQVEAAPKTTAASTQ